MGVHLLNSTLLTLAVEEGDVLSIECSNGALNVWLRNPEAHRYLVNLTLVSPSIHFLVVVFEYYFFQLKEKLYKDALK